VDCYSDIDFVLYVHNEMTDLAGLHDDVRRVVAATGDLVAAFPANHIGLPNLLVFFVLYQDRIVKVDVELCHLAAISTPQAVTLISDPNDQAARCLARLSALPGVTLTSDAVHDMDQKMCGWVWYAYTKLARGELFEAWDAIDVMRRLVVVPCLHSIQDLPREGFRRLEQRLAQPLLERLRECYPTSLDRQELLRALRTTAVFYKDMRPEWERRLAGLKLTGRMDRVLAEIDRFEREQP
jgi:hypothetical protein